MGSGNDRRRRRSYDQVSPGSFRAESCYVFPDGSVRRALDSSDGGEGTRQGAGGSAGGGQEIRRVPSVPFPLVGTSRLDSADLSTALERRAESGGSGGGNDTSGGVYRSPGTTPAADRASDGRPPRTYVPFLNLPGFDRQEGGVKSQRRHRQGEDSTSGGGLQSSVRPPTFSAQRTSGRGRPSAGEGGRLVSPGRAMLTGAGRPATGSSSAATSSSRLFFGGEMEGDGDGGGHRRRRRRRPESGDSSQKDDGNSSDAGDSVGSGSTDVEFLRRRAEVKLRSLERREASDTAAGNTKLGL